MKKHKICKILLVILAIFLCVAFYELLGICVAYKKQPEVSNTIKKETQNDSWNERSENMERAVIIEKNPEALLCFFFVGIRHFRLFFICNADSEQFIKSHT